MHFHHAAFIKAVMKEHITALFFDVCRDSIDHFNFLKWQDLKGQCLKLPTVYIHSKSPLCV